MKDVLAPLWTAGPFVSGVAVPASSVDDLFLPAGSKVGSQYARLVVNATVDEGGTVYFVVCAVPATGGDDDFEDDIIAPRRPSNYSIERK